MRNILSRIGAILKSIQLKQLVTAVLLGAVLITTNVAAADLSPGVKAKLDETISKGETGRPRTTEQWQEENEALQGQPGKQLERIAKESADAIGEMAEIYPQNVRTLTPGVEAGKLPTDD